MNRLEQLVNTEEFSFPSLFPAELSDFPVHLEDKDDYQNSTILIVNSDNGEEMSFSIPNFRRDRELAEKTKFGGVFIGHEVKKEVSDDHRVTYIQYMNANKVAMKFSFISQFFERDQSGYRRVRKTNCENPLHEIALMNSLREELQWQEDKNLSESGFAYQLCNCMTNMLAAIVGDEYIVNIMKNLPNSIDTLYYNSPLVPRKSQVIRSSPQLNMGDDDTAFTLKVEEAKIVFREVMKSVVFLHSKGVAHRDISAENILLSIDPDLPSPNHIKNVLLIDYGMATVHPDFQAIHNTDNTDPFETVSHHYPFYGKTTYRPPECHYRSSDRNIDPRALDVWACGALLYLLVYNRPLFQAAFANTDKVFSAFMNDPKHNLLHILSKVVPKNRQNTSLFDLLNQMMVLVPEERISAQDVLNHPFLA